MKRTFLKFIIFTVIIFTATFLFSNSAKAAYCNCVEDSIWVRIHTMKGDFTTEQACSEACRTTENSSGNKNKYYRLGDGDNRPIMAAGNVQCLCSSGEGQIYQADIYTKEIPNSSEGEKNCESICKSATVDHSDRKAKFYSYAGGSYKAIATAEILPGESSGPITEDLVPGVTVGESKIIQCGRPGQDMCHLCDLIKGFYNIIKYIQGIAIGVALLAMAIGGIIYIVSAGDPGLMDMAKSAIKNAAIGFVIVFASYLIINTSILYLGTKADLGINASWGTFDCDSRAADHIE